MQRVKRLVGNIEKRFDKGAAIIICPAIGLLIGLLLSVVVVIPLEYRDAAAFVAEYPMSGGFLQNWAGMSLVLGGGLTLGLGGIGLLAGILGAAGCLDSPG